MESNNTIIRFLRCNHVETSRQLAVVHLTEDIEHIVGQPVLVPYYVDLSQIKIDCILAMGVKNGKGKDCYSIISTGQFKIIWDIVTQLPDVSSLVHGEVYIYHDEEQDRWYEVFTEDGVLRKKVPISGEHNIYINLKDNSLWASDEDMIVRPLTDFYTRAEVNTLLDELKDYIDLPTLKDKIDQALDQSEEALEDIQEIEEEIQRIEEGTTSLRVIAQLHDYLTVKLKKVNGNVRENNWFDNDDTRVFAVDALEFELVYHHYDGTTPTDLDSVTIEVAGLPGIEILPNESGYYTNPVSISLTRGQTLEIPITFNVTRGEIVKSASISLYGLEESRYYGRVNSNNILNTVGLVKDSEYVWGHLAQKSQINIPSTLADDDKKYFAYLYPSSWGNLQRIESGAYNYYTPERDSQGTSTFTKTTTTIGEIEFNVYLYRNENIDEAINVNFI